YVEDGLSWSSYLCGQFESSCKVFWEDVSKLPLNDKASSIIKSARAQLLIISPQYIELYDEYIHNLLINPIGFLCGVEVDSVDYTEFVKRNPVFTEWMLVSATDDIEKIASVVFQAIEMATPPDDMYVRVDRPARKSTKKSKYPRDIAKKLNKDKMVIQPSKALCGEAATLVVILKAALLTDTTTKYTVKFKSATKEIDMEATRLNEFTLTVQVPQDFPPGSAIATVTKPGVLSSLGECRFKFEDKLKHISDYILDTLNPIDFLCQAMEISPSDVVVLDNILTSNYKKSMPWEGLDKMGSIVHEMQAVAKTRETPTLIHFAAKFGLRELCALLINSPGAILAYEIENCNGDYPHDLASQSGYEDLAVFLSSFVHDQDDLYMCMDQAPVNPYYNFLALQRQLEIQGLYDVPFGVAIPADPLFDCKRNELEKLINGEETDIENIYDTLPGLSDDIYDSVEDEDRATPAPFDLASRYSFRRPVMSTGPGKTIEDPSEIYSAAQKELINIQKQVKDKMISIDDAVRIFEAFKLHEKDQFYSYKTQTEFIYAARDSLSKNKEKLQSQQQQQPSRAPAAPPDIPPRGVSEEQERWNKLYRKMTVKVDKGARKKKAIRRGSEEFSRGIQRHGRDGSNSSTASIGVIYCFLTLEFRKNLHVSRKLIECDTTISVMNTKPNQSHRCHQR
ncbi:phosphoinositide 3-kinase adapter protein 1-like, partial [Saccoglossus kowalevskii]